MATKRNYYEPSQEADEALYQMQLNHVKHQVEELGWSVASATRYAEMTGAIGNPLVKEYLENYRPPSKKD